MLSAAAGTGEGVAAFLTNFCSSFNGVVVVTLSDCQRTVQFSSSLIDSTKPTSSDTLLGPDFAVANE